MYKRQVLVTGAGGGVGSVATVLLAKRGYQVAAMTGRAEIADYLTDLGASRIVSREEMLDDPGKPMESGVWAAASTVSAVRFSPVPSSR